MYIFSYTKCIVKVSGRPRGAVMAHPGGPVFGILNFGKNAKNPSRYANSFQVSPGKPQLSGAGALREALKGGPSGGPLRGALKGGP